MTVRVEHADMLQAIPRLVAEGVVCDAVVTDPPYHLTEMSKRFGAKLAAMPRLGADGAHRRLAAGFMGQQWDGGDIAFRPETWATVATILRPGAFLVAFGGARTYHRLACAIEDGGFVIQDCVMWVFATGFPKRRDMLKPAWESIVIAQKENYSSEPIETIRSWLCELRDLLDRMGTLPSGMAKIIALSTVSSWLDTLAAFSIHESTSTTEMASKTTIDWKTLRSCLSTITPESITQAHSQGHLSIANASPAIRFFDAELMRLRTILAPSAADLATSPGLIERLAATGVGAEPIVLAYKPGGKRTMQIDECRVEASDNTTKACRGAGNRDREQYRTGTTGATIATDLGRWPANLATDGSDEVLAAFPESAGSVGEFRRAVSKNYESTVQIAGRNQDIAGIGYGDSGSAARFFFSAKAGAQDRWGSRHPTIKPVELMKWLVALVTPPGGLVLDCFAGSGTTGVAALATGRNAILIEREETYHEDIKARLAHYEGGGRHSLASKGRQARPRGETPLFPEAAQ